MGVRNYLIEGVSGTGKTSVAEELARRGYHVIHGDRTLAHRGDPATGRPLDGPYAGREADLLWQHDHWIWPVATVRSLATDRRHGVTFFCGGSRNHRQFIDVFDGVFVLEVDPGTLRDRLAKRPSDEFGGGPAERDLVMLLHATKAGLPETAMVIDATAPLECVVDDILARIG